MQVTNKPRHYKSAWWIYTEFEDCRELCLRLTVDEQNTAPPLILVFWKCLVDNKDINANPHATNPPKSIGNLYTSIVKHPPHLPTCLPPPACGKRWRVLHSGFLKISIGFVWISCMWIRIHIFILYKAFPEDKYE